ncbi:MAG TPA: transglutaminase-like domain-containing protein [Candidatus Saccharibacteria bacterium]|nr:transglutaminase-like domain-containing protein [Candidatus Saccharibacteria bacterium]
MDNNIRLKELKELSSIEIPAGTNRLQTALLIADFAHSAFSHNGDSKPSSSDPVTILTEAQAGSSFRCVEYSHLAAWLMVAHGIDVRTLNIMNKDVETMEYGAGHVVVEFYEGKQHGWVMADIQAGVVARQGGVLQSAFELRDSLDEASIEDFRGNKFVAAKGMFGGNYKEWLRPYLYFIDRSKKLNYEYSDDSEPHLILVPDGGKPPKFFQRNHKLNLIVTSPDVFYKVK